MSSFRKPVSQETIDMVDGRKPIPAPAPTSAPTCNCITTPCNCPTQQQIQERQRLQEGKGMSNTTKWAILIGGTLVLYYLIFKVSEGK